MRPPEVRPMRILHSNAGGALRIAIGTCLLVVALLGAPVLAGEAELHGVAERVGQGLAYPCDPEPFNSRVDFTPTAYAVVDELGIARDKVLAGFLNGLHGVDIGSTLCAASGPGVEFGLVKSETLDGKLEATYRVRSSEGLNYFKFVFEEYDGRVVISDVWNYMTAVRLSENLQDTLVEMTRKRNLVERIFSYGQSWMDYIGRHDKVMKDIAEGNYGRAHSELERIPEAVLNGRHFLLVRFHLALAEGDWESRLELSDRLAELAGERPEVDLLVLDARIEQGQFDAAEAGVLRLREHLGDPYLEVIQANILILAGNLSEARVATEAALAANEAEGLWPLLSLEVLEEDADGAFEALDRMRAELDVDPGEVLLEFMFAGEPFSRFVDSRRFKKWSKRANREIRKKQASSP